MPSSAVQVVHKSFDYNSLDAETSQFVQQTTDEIRTLIQRTREGIIETGQKLNEVKKRLKHGQFGDWLEAEFAWSWDTANRWMNVTNRLGGKIPHGAEIDDRALYLLAAKSTPESARSEALARAKAGEPITYPVAQAIKRKYTPPTRRKPAAKETPTSASSQSVSQPSITLQPEPQNQPTANLRPKAEIVAIRPKEAVQELALTQETETASPTIPSTKSTRIQTGTWWQVAQQHLLYCGSPGSSRFQERLPNQVSLQLTFPPSRSNWQESVSPKIKSALCLWSSYPDQNLRLLRELVERALLLYTESSETVAFSFLPDPELLILAHELECCCLVAEPDLQRCQEAIALWQTKGYKVERVKTLRF
jgi:hypothetical protein